MLLLLRALYHIFHNIYCSYFYHHHVIDSEILIRYIINPSYKTNFMEETVREKRSIQARVKNDCVVSCSRAICFIVSIIDGVMYKVNVDAVPSWMVSINDAIILATFSCINASMMACRTNSVQLIEMPRLTASSIIVFWYGYIETENTLLLYRERSLSLREGAIDRKSKS